MFVITVQSYEKRPKYAPTYVKNIKIMLSLRGLGDIVKTY